MGVASTPSARLLEMATALGEDSGMSDERSESIKVILLLGGDFIFPWRSLGGLVNRHGSDTTGGAPFTFLAPHCSTHFTTAASSLPRICLGYLVLSAATISVNTGGLHIWPGPVRIGLPKEVNSWAN
jgi:hypothetical protein